MTNNRAQYIKDNYLDKMTHRISGSIAEEFFQVYNTEVNPGRFKEMPCGCSPTTWKNMISETASMVDRVLSAWEDKSQKKGKTK